MPGAFSGLRERFEQIAEKPWHLPLRIRRGTMADYALLAEHHYRAARPATVTRVWAAECASHEEIVGVLIESMPTLASRWRDIALDGRYAGAGLDREKARLLNHELRCISRVVVDPRFRGIGVAVTLVKAALAHAQTPYTEALAAMARINPFFEHAGMTAYGKEGKGVAYYLKRNFELRI